MSNPRVSPISLRGLCPPLLSELFRRWSGSAIRFTGVFRNWQDASARATGYSAEAILQQAATATRKVMSGEARSERDGVTFDQALHPFPLISTLLMAAAEMGELTVLDFGGALGSTYFQCRDFLKPLQRLQWCVVEQAHFVEAGSHGFSSGDLQFFKTVSDVLAAHRPNVILFSSSLQYLPEPDAVLKEVIGSRARYIVLDRTPFISGDQSLISLQITPKQIVESSYPVWLFSEARVKSLFSKHYTEFASFEAVDGVIGRGRLRATFKGIVFRRIEGMTK